MQLSLSSLLAVSAAVPALAWTPSSVIDSDKIYAAGQKKLFSAVRDGSLKTLLATKGVSQTCNLANVAIRREYSTLSDAEKLDYINSVKCLMAKPSKIPAGLAPGAKSRYDDFVAIHINQTTQIHMTGSFLSWHRYYTWAFERALRDECGYKGYVPYWNWGKSAEDVMNSPYMDGSDLSMGGNGVFEKHDCTRPGSLFAPCIAAVVEGRGGGCVETGPFKGIEANISAVDVWFDYPNQNANLGPFLSYMPRCMKRDISPEYSQARAGDDKLVTLLTYPDHATIGPFQDASQNGTGLHSVGHFIFGGNPGGDIYTSPNDPMFWLHHGMIDRVWTMWQSQDIQARTFQIAGTRTMRNTPPSDNATIDDILFMDYITPAGMPVAGSPISQHVSTVGGPYCYIYADDLCKQNKRRRRRQN